MEESEVRNHRGQVRAAVGADLLDEGSLAKAHVRSLHRVNVGAVDAAQALADLTEISSQIEAAVLFDAAGSVQGSTLSSDDAARALATAGTELLDRAAGFRSDPGPVTHLDAARAGGSVVVVRDAD